MKNLIKLLFAVVLFGVFGFNAQAQTVTSTNKANAIIVQSLASVSSPVRGMIVFSKTDGGASGAFYVRDYTKWVPLAEVLASNGLTKGTTDNTIRLGGALTAATTISLAGFEFRLGDLLYSTNPTTDDILVADPTTGSVKKVKVADFLSNLTVSNGLTKVGNDIQLGGPLSKPTTIATSAANPLNITGLTATSVPGTNNVVITDPSTGTLTQITPADLLAGSTTNSLTSAVNTMTSTVNGKTATAPIVNSNVVGLTGNDLTSTVNGVASSAQSLNGLQLTGDVSGTLNATSVDKLKGTPLSIGTLADKNILQYDDATKTWKNVDANASLAKNNVTTTTTAVTITNPTGQVVGGSDLGINVANYVGANATTAGVAGLVNPAAAGDQGKVLSGAGTWVDPNAALAKKDITATGSVVTVANGAGQVVGATNVNLDVQGTAGGVLYGSGTGTSAAFTAAGTANQILKSNGAAAPSWADASSLVTIAAPNAGSTANAGTITTNGSGVAELKLSPADGSNPGIVTTGAQTIAGVKTFQAPPIIQNLTTGTSTDNAVVADPSTGQLKQISMSNLIVRATLTSTIDFPADGFYLQGKASYTVAGAKVGDVVQVTITSVPATVVTPQTAAATSASADVDITGQAAIDAAGFSITNGYVSADGTVTLTLASAQIIKGSIGVLITVVKGS